MFNSIIFFIKYYKPFFLKMVFKNLLDKFLRFFFFISNLIITRTAVINAAVFSRFEPIEVDMDLFKKS